jgi:hypothetical protein
MEQTQNGARQFISAAFEAFSACTDTNVKIFRQLTDFSANGAKESISLTAELQASSIEAWQEGQGYVLRRLRGLSEAAENPGNYYQQSLRELVESAEKTQKLLQNNAQALMRSSEQYWLTARQASHSIQTSYTQLADKLKSLYASD